MAEAAEMAAAGRPLQPRTIAKSASSSVEAGDGLRWAEGAAFGSQGHGHLRREPSFSFPAPKVDRLLSGPNPLHQVLDTTSDS